MLRLTTLLATGALLCAGPLSAAENDSIPAMSEPMSEGGGTALVGAPVVSSTGDRIGIVDGIRRDADGSPIEIVMAPRDENGMSSSEADTTPATPDRAASLDAYVSRWQGAVDDWSEVATRRSTEEVNEAWREVENRWEDLQESTSETWKRGRDAFEAAFESFERTWAQHEMERRGG